MRKAFTLHLLALLVLVAPSIFIPTAHAAFSHTAPQPTGSPEWQRSDSLNCSGTWTPGTPTITPGTGQHVDDLGTFTGCGNYLIQVQALCGDAYHADGTHSNHGCNDSEWRTRTAIIACPPNSSTNGAGQCIANDGYLFDGSQPAGTAPVPQTSCGPEQYLITETNSCSYFPCGGSTPYTFTDQNGVATCSPPPESAGCYSGDEAFIATGQALGEKLPDFIDANGCRYKLGKCSDYGETCTPEEEANLTKAACVGVDGDTSCGGHYIGTGEGSYTPNDSDQPFTGSNPEFSDPGTEPGGGGDPGGGGSDDGHPGCGGLGQPACPDEDGDGEPDPEPEPGECDPATQNCENEHDCDPSDPNCTRDVQDWQNPGSTPGYFPELDADLTAAKNGLQTSFETIKAEASGILSFSMAGTGSLPCDSVDLGPLGVHSFCVATYSEELHQVGQMLVAVFSLLALFIILS